jgi:hypothetical protein
MYARKDRAEYFCSTYHRHRCEGTVSASPCNRNAVAHDVLEEYVSRYLDETGQRLALLTGPDAAHLTDHLSDQQDAAWGGYFAGLTRLTQYLAAYHTDEYNAILAEQQTGACTPDEFVAAVVACYRAKFDAAAVRQAITAAEADLHQLMEDWRTLPNIPLVRKTAQDRMAAAAAHIEELKQQEHDAADVVAQHRREINDLIVHIAEAKQALQSEVGTLALRRRAEALRGLLVEIRCEFIVTGKGVGKRPGPGEARSRLAAIEFLPIAGAGLRLPAAAGTGNSSVTGGHSAARSADPA